MWIRDNILFVDNQSAAFTSDVFNNYKDDEMTVQVDGTFSSATIIVEGRTNTGGDWYPMALIDLASLSLIEDGAITAKGRYDTAISGAKQVRVRVTAVSGGTVTVFGMAVSSAGV